MSGLGKLVGESEFLLNSEQKQRPWHSGIVKTPDWCSENLSWGHQDPWQHQGMASGTQQ